jgi:hypothetical protein
MRLVPPNAPEDPAGSHAEDRVDDLDPIRREHRRHRERRGAETVPSTSKRFATALGLGTDAAGDLFAVESRRVRPSLAASSEYTARGKVSGQTVVATASAWDSHPLLRIEAELTADAERGARRLKKRRRGRHAASRHRASPIVGLR